jgi:hypothetical protein
MGDISEMRAVIVILAFVVFTVSLVGLMVSESPSMFMGIAQGSSGVDTSQSVSPSGIIAWNETYTLNLTHAMPPPFEFQIGGWNVMAQKYDSPGLSIETYDAWWIFMWNLDPFKWYHNGVEVSISGSTIAYGQMYFITPSQLDSDFAAKGVSGLKYTIKNTRTQMDVTFAFNTTKYATPSLAYLGNEISLIFDLNWNERNTSVNALAFISGIFTFSLPGLPFIPNLILWLIIFPAAMYLAFIFVLRVIGAVFGGGGA